MNELLQKRKVTDVRKHKIGHRLAEACLEEKDMTYLMLQFASLRPTRVHKAPSTAGCSPCHCTAIKVAVQKSPWANADRAHTGQGSLGLIITC